MIQSLDPFMLGAVAENHRVWFRRLSEAAGAPVIAIGADELCLARESMIFPRANIDADALMEAIRTAGVRSVGCWSLGDDNTLATRLMARGFRWGWRPHWMAIDVSDPKNYGSAFAVEPALAPYAKTLPYAPVGPEPPEATRLGVRMRGKIVGSVIMHPYRGVAGLYAMGVVSKLRRRGIGTALVRAALGAAGAAGCHHVVLNATEDGARCYTACGFRSLGLGADLVVVTGGRALTPPGRAR